MKFWNKATVVGVMLVFIMCIGVVPITATAANRKHSESNTESVTSLTERIDERISYLQNLIIAIQTKLITTEEKAMLTQNAQTTIAGLEKIKASAASGTDSATIKSLMQSVRMYGITSLKTHMQMRALNMDVRTDLMGDTVEEFEIRIGEAKTAGHDVTSITNTLADMKARLADAEVQYNNGKIAAATILGDETMNTQNVAIAKTIRAMIKQGSADLHAATIDGRKILAGLKAFGK